MNPKTEITHLGNEGNDRPGNNVELLAYKSRDGHNNAKTYKHVYKRY
jgi:hypothetical protein